VETLAIVAYRQPITRPEVDEVRGVDSGSALKVLLERGLVRTIGRREEPGRPLLYGTTSHFLEFFGLRNLRDLPMLREYTELSPESEATLTETLGDETPAPTAGDGPAEPPAER
jgi:segregation and condensation protein B